jgi:DNA-directed RNA polymerase specialized sigma24 family protein
MIWAKKYTDDTIKDIFQNNPAEQRRVLEYICKNESIKNKVRHVALYQQGNQQDADDLWQDTYIVTHKKLLQGDFRGSHSDKHESLEFFIVGIAKYLWLNQRRKKKPNFSTEQLIDETSEIDLDKWLLRKEGRYLLTQLIDNMSEKCRRLLHLYNMNFSMREIKNELHLPTEKRANKDTDICRKKLRLYLLDHPELLNALDPYLE